MKLAGAEAQRTPEFESDVDSLAQNLASLDAVLQKASANADMRDEIADLAQGLYALKESREDGVL
jgi:hypothetical protein